MIRKTLLHVGCGNRPIGSDLPDIDFKTDWREIRVDIDPGVKPHVVDDIASLSKIPDGSAQMVFSKHNIEHLDTHQVPGCLRSFCRVLDDSGFALIRTPDLGRICELVIEHGPETPLRSVNRGKPLKALDMLFGASWEIESGNSFMAHRTAFTQQSLYEQLRAAGFEGVEVRTARQDAELFAIALKNAENNIYWEVKDRVMRN